MPVIHIESLPPEREKELPKILEEITSGIVKDTGLPADRVQLYFTEIKNGRYIYNGVCREHLSADAAHPMVHIYVKDGKTREFLEKLVLSAARNVSAAFEIEPENVLVMVNQYSDGEFFCKNKFM